MQRRRPLGGTTIAAGVLHLILTAGTAAFWGLAVLLIGLLGAGFAKNEHDRQQANTFLLIGFVVLIVVAAVFVALGVLFLRRRSWARWTLIVIYGCSIAWAIANVVSGLFSHRSPVLAIAYVPAVIELGLLAHPRTAEDFAADHAPSGPPPADWYPDPGDAHNLRYWNGNTWTGHVSPRASPRSSSEITSTPAARKAAAVIPSPERSVRENEPS